MRPFEGFGFVLRANADLAKPISCAHLRDYIIPFVMFAAVEIINLSVGEGFPLPFSLCQGVCWREAKCLQSKLSFEDRNASPTDII